MSDRGAALSGRQHGTSDHQSSDSAAATAIDDRAGVVGTDGPGHRDRHGQEPRSALCDDQGFGGCRTRRPLSADPTESARTAALGAACAQLACAGSVSGHLAERAVGRRPHPIQRAGTRAVASAPNTQHGQASTPWWRQPAVLILAALVAVASSSPRRRRHRLAGREFRHSVDRHRCAPHPTRLRPSRPHFRRYRSPSPLCRPRPPSHRPAPLRCRPPTV